MINYRLLLKKIKSKGLNAVDVCRNILHANTRLDLCINSRHNGLSHEEIMQLKSLLGLSSVEVMRIFFMDKYITLSDGVVMDKISLLELALRRFNPQLRLLVNNISNAKCLMFSLSEMIAKIAHFQDKFIPAFSISKNNVYPENEDKTIAWYSNIRFTINELLVAQHLDFLSFPTLFTSVTFCDGVFCFVINNI